jgi:hypothetical protein
MSGSDEGGPLRPLPASQRRIVAFALIAGGSVFIAGGLRWIDIAPAPGVPQWLIGVVGALFALAGVAAGLGPRPSRGLALVAALLVTGFAVVAGWIAFGPGARTFATTAGAGALAVGGGANGGLGRVAFGIGAAVCGAWALALWWRALRPLPADDAG